jgi:hypothetical protein
MFPCRTLEGHVLQDRLIGTRDVGECNIAEGKRAIDVRGELLTLVGSGVNLGRGFDVLAQLLERGRGALEQWKMRSDRSKDNTGWSWSVSQYP